VEIYVAESILDRITFIACYHYINATLIWRRDGRIELQPLSQSIRFQGGAGPSPDNPPLFDRIVVLLQELNLLGFFFREIVNQ
jgi:hypothetical protein